MAITPAAMQALSAIRPAAVGGDQKVFGLSESQIARRVKAIAKAAGLPDWELFSGHSGRVGMARRMAQNGAAHPRDRAPGPLEAARRHGRPLHPRRDRRVSAQVPVIDGLSPGVRHDPPPPTHRRRAHCRPPARRRGQNRHHQAPPARGTEGRPITMVSFDHGCSPSTHSRGNS